MHSATKVPKLRRSILRTREEAVAELSRPCGRFILPEHIEDRLASYITGQVRHLDPLAEGQVFLADSTPLNWQRMLAYLYRNQVIDSSHFLSGQIRDDMPKIANFALSVHRTSRPTDGRTTSNGGYGGAHTQEEAMSKTVGETLERYFLSLYSRKSMHRASFASLQKSRNNPLDITRLNGFLPWQRAAFPEFEHDADTELYWVKGNAYPSGETAALPAQLVFWNYRHVDAAGAEQMLMRGTTSGCAGHFSREEAILSGVLELIQRDGFVIFWLNRISPPVLDVSLMNDPEITEMLQYLERYRLEPTFVNTTSDIGVPSITCVLKDVSCPDEPAFSVGAGTGFDIKNILIHAATEATLVHASWAQRSYTLPENYAPFLDKSIDRKKRLGMWRGARMAERFSFFTSGKKQDPQELITLAEGKGTVDAQLTYVTEQLRSRGEGYELYVYEAHDKVLDVLGFHTVRTIVPQLVPLYLLEYTATLDSKRLREVPGRLGYEAATEYNQWPHPFP